MITADNLNEVLKSLKAEEVHKALDSDKDFVLLEVFHFNAGSVSSLTAFDYDEEKETEAADNGQLFCDKDDFLRLASEVETDNATINEYL